VPLFGGPPAPAPAPAGGAETFSDIVENDLTIEGACVGAWEKIILDQTASDKTAPNWCLFAYNKEGGKAKVTLAGSGNGGMNEMVAAMSSDQVFFGGFRVVGVDDRGNLVQRRAKFAKLFVRPDDAPVMLKAKAGRHKTNVFNAMRSGHVEFDFTAASDLTEAEVIAKLRACGGAHQPTAYEF
jgi:hypothetical protein